MSALCFGLVDFLGYRVVALVLLFTVSVLAISFDILPVLLAAALSAFIWNFFFIPPRFTVHVRSTEDIILLIMYFVIAMISGVLTYKIRQVEKAARLKEERANSVKLYNTILNSLSHELKTPIAAIIAATDNLQSNKNLDKKNAAELVDEISKAGLRLNQQVENLLNISRLESGHIKPKNDWTDVVELVYDVVKRVEENNPGRKINISTRQDLPLFAIDKGMLDQVIYNLLNNAAVHTHPSCTIGITLLYIPNILQVLIEDNGGGFRDVGAKDIFEKFSRNRNTNNSGSGLGLSIVKGFTEALGGTIEFQALDPGSRFIVSVPVKTTYINEAVL
jgi:two-component system sensor histidine kinase KdpD